MSAERSVLVVDDDPTIVSMMRDFLEAEGFRVDDALSTGEAQSALARGPVDCVLLDRFPAARHHSGQIERFQRAASGTRSGHSRRRAVGKRRGSRP